jgi:hypothetical protein
MGIEVETVHAKGIENIVNKNNNQKFLKFWERDSHPGTECF